MLRAKITLWSIGFFLFFILVEPVNAVVLSLRQSGTELTDFNADIEQPLTVDLHIDPKVEDVVGISTFLTFNTADLQLIDTKKETLHVTEGAESTDLLKNWVILDNDMHGDPGNTIKNSQIDYVVLLFSGDGEAIINPGIVAQFKFKPLRATKQTSIQFDQDESRSRLTEVTLLTKSGQQKQVSATLNSARFDIRGGPILKPIPEVRFLRTEISAPLYLDNYVEEGKTPKQQLKWLDIAHSKILTQIDPITHKVTFSVKENAKDDFFGRTIIKLQVIDTQQHTAMAEVNVEVMTAPTLTLLPNKRLRLNRQEVLDLGQFVTDADQPDLNGLTWTWSLVEKSLNDDVIEVNINQNLATLRGKRETEKAIVQFIARDTDGNKAKANMNLIVLPDFNGPIVSDLPLLVFTVDGHQVLPVEGTFNLDDYVIDALAEDEQIKWEIIGNKLIQVQGLGSRRPTFQANISGIKEEFLIVAENHLNQKSNQKPIWVEIVPVGVPPEIDQERLQSDLLNKDGWLVLLVDPDKTLPFEKRSRQVILKKYVQDYDSQPEDIQWSVKGNNKIQVVIEKNTATLSSSVVAEETLTFKATDPNSYTDTVKIAVKSVKVTPPKIKQLPQPIKLKVGQSWSNIDLDQYVSDTFTPPNLIKWFAITPDPKLVTAKILADRQLELKVVSNWAGEIVILLTATNQFGKIAKQNLKVRVTAIPKLVLPQEVSLQAGWKRKFQLDQYVEDTDSPDDTLQWNIIPKLSPVAELKSKDRQLILKGAKDKIGQTFPVQISVVDKEGNQIEAAIRITVLITSQSPPLLAESIQKEISFINDESASIDLTKKILYPNSKESIDDELISSNLSFNFQPKNQSSKIQIQQGQEGGQTFIFSTPKVADDFEIRPAEIIILTIESPDGSSMPFSFRVSVFPSKPILKADQLKKPIILYPNLEQVVDLRRYVQQKEGISWQIENMEQLSKEGLSIFTDRKEPTLKTLKFTQFKDQKLNLIGQRQAQDVDFLLDNQCPDPKHCFGFDLQLKASRKDKFNLAKLSVLIVKPPELKINKNTPIIFWSNIDTDEKQSKTFRLSDLVQEQKVSKQEWRFGKITANSNSQTNLVVVEAQTNDLLTLRIYDSKSNKWIEPNSKQAISINTSIAFLQLTPKEKFATDFKQGNLIVTASDIWNQKATANIPIQLVQPPRFQDFPKIINIFCGEANYQSAIGSSYLDLYPLVFLDPLVNTDKTKLQWSWQIWDNSSKKYRKPKTADRLKIDFGPSRQEVQITEKLMTISTTGDFFAINEKTPSKDKKIQLIVTDPTGNKTRQSTVDVTLRIWQPKTASEQPILQGLKDQIIYPNQELTLQFTLFDLDNSAEELVWVQSVPEVLVATSERNAPLAGIQKGMVKIKMAQGFEEVRGNFKIKITIKDPDCNELEKELTITIADPPDKTQPKIEVFALHHPLSPKTVFITVISDETLREAPSVTVGKQRLTLLKNNGQLTWHQIYHLEDKQQEVVTVSAKGTDLNKNTGRGQTVIKIAKKSSAAPNKLPRLTKLHANYPNPFNPETWIPYQLTQSTNVSFKIYDLDGMLIREFERGWQSAGFYLIPSEALYWDGKTKLGEPVSSGNYFCQIITNHQTEVLRLTVLK